MRTINTPRKLSILLLGCFMLSGHSWAQTANDAIMMNKKQFCNGFSYTYATWTKYWEGTLKRNNDNIGRFTGQGLVYMGAYGITDNLNVMAGVPYLWNRVSAGTLHTMEGFQDLSLDVKWRFFNKEVGPGKLGLYAVGGFSTPLSNYQVDFLPLAIGLGTTNLTGRVIANYKVGIFFVRGSAAYTYRSDTKIDRTSYYTTEMHLTNQVDMPDVFTFNGSLGIHTKYLIAEAMVDGMQTLGGFDIRRNDMPFPSNRMNSTALALHAKYTLPFYTHLQIDAMGNYVVAGRNVGQAAGFMIGAYYVFTFKHKYPKGSNSSNQ